MVRLYARLVAFLYFSLILVLSPGLGVSLAQADSSNNSAPAKVTTYLPTSNNLPGGTPISVEITAPSDGAVKVFPPGSIDVEGTASVGAGVITKNTTVVYIMDISDSMNLNAGVDCDGISGTDTRFDCEKQAVRRANNAAKMATSSVDLTGLGSFEGSAQCISTAYDVDLGTTGTQLLVDPNLDGDGNGIADVEQVAAGIATGVFTCYIGGLERADEILATSNNAINLIFFMSDGENNVGSAVSSFSPQHFGSNTRIYAFAMGTSVSCSANGGPGSLNDVVAKSTLGGGICQQVTNLAQLDNFITQAMGSGSSLNSIEQQLDGGSFVDITASANPAIPVGGLAGPTGNVSFSASNIPAAPGIHNLCIRANGKDSGGPGSVTQCIQVTVADIELSPPTATNELSVGSSHTVTARVAAGADGGVTGVTVSFEILTGPNAGAVGSGTTDGNGEATFTYTPVLGAAGVGTDVIQACFGPDEQGDTACDTATKDWVSPPVDLSIIKFDSPDPVTAGTNLTYTLTVTNNGPSDATGVTVTDTLPAGVIFDPATSTPGCTEAGGVVTCTVGNLANGASTTVTINVTLDTATPAGTITNTASVTGVEADPNPADNTASADTVIIAASSVCPILDDFNRADGPLGSNWAGRTRGYRINNNQVAVRRGRPIYWQPEVYGPDQEACVTLTRINPKSRMHALLLKVQELNNWRKGAILVNYNGRSGNVEVKARDVANHKWILVGMFTPSTPVMDGDQLRAKAFADGTVEVFLNSTSLGVVDAGSFYANKGGQIGLWFRGRQADDDEDEDHDQSIQSKDHNDDDEGDDDGPSGHPALLDDFGGGTIIQAGLPDLTVTITSGPTPDCPPSGCTTTVGFVITNTSTVNVTSSFEVLIEAPGIPSKTITVNGLAAGANQNFSETLAGFCFNPDCTARVTVDSTNIILESNETNNVSESTVIG